MVNRFIYNTLTLSLYVLAMTAYIKVFMTGEVFIYLRSRYAYLSIAVFIFLFVLTVFSFYLLLVKKKVVLKFKVSYLVLFIPFIIAIVHTPQSYSINTLQKKMRKYKLSKNPLLYKRFKAVHDKNKDLIVITKDNFYLYIYEFYQKKRFRNYVHNPFVIRGIYFKNKSSFFDNHAFVGRMIMACCAADAIMDGFFLKFNNKLPTIKPGKWIEVKGKLIFENVKNHGKMPVIEVSSYEEIKAESSIYIIPALPRGLK